ncbi:MAG: class F sortase [Anaerolineales bacterium]|nr:MAG: class F sortase [Anaerolineales bacterium]
MNARSKPFINIFPLLALLISLVGGAISVTPARAATFTVTKTADTNDGICDVDCSLREAIAAANAAAGADIITLPAGTYTLTLGGELLITSDITINGAGAGTTIIEANAASGAATYRVLHNNGGVVTINGVTIRHGNCAGSCNGLVSNGGGIYNQAGSLTLDASTVSRNLATVCGGGIYNAATLIIQNGSVIGGAYPANGAGNCGGGIYNHTGGSTTINASTVSGNYAGATGTGGGGIYNASTLNIENGSTIGGVGAGNQSFAPGRGGGIYNAAGTTTINSSTVSANTTGVEGGGIYNVATLNIQNGSVIGGAGAGNTATSNGGGIYNGTGGTVTIDASTVSANRSNTVASGGGGGIYNIATLTIQNGSTIGGAAGNTAPNGGDGGGIYNGVGGTTTIDSSTVSANTANIAGGGIYNSYNLAITNSTIASNGGVINGGGIYNQGTISEITNSTISGNAVFFSGGGIYNFGTITSIRNSTFSGNSAPFGGGGIYNWTSGTVTGITNTFIANSPAGSNCTGTIPAGSGNLASDATCNAAWGTITPGTHYNTTLAGNGGLTQTHALVVVAGNPAIDTGGACGLATDQRGVTRPQGAACDIGAYEVDAPPTVTVEQASGQTDPTSASPINFTAIFSEPINIASFTDSDITLDGTAGATTAVITEIAPNNGTTFNITVSGMTGSGTVTASIAANLVEDSTGNLNTASTSTDNTVTYDIGSPTVVATTLQTSYTNTGPSNFTITFSEDVSNAGGGAGADDVTNVNNYKIINKGTNGTLDTASCASALGGDDSLILPASITYINPTAVVNLSAPLPVGSYRLFVCGTTSITDLIGNRLNDGLSDYTLDFIVTAGSSSGATEEEENVTASSLPATGFSPNRTTSLPSQPADLSYANLGDIWLEIPSLNVKSPIVGVPQADDNTWDVTWLGNATGWLHGTAFPTWKGNSVLTAHVYNASGLEGPFAVLKSLRHGDQIIVHLFGGQYVYEVRDSRLARPYSTSYAFQSLQDHSHLTLITCQFYNPFNETYLFRRVVRAVLVDVKY